MKNVLSKLTSLSANCILTIAACLILLIISFKLAAILLIIWAVLHVTSLYEMKFPDKWENLDDKGNDGVWHKHFIISPVRIDGTWQIFSYVNRIKENGIWVYK